jgi:hypothetical protein
MASSIGTGHPRCSVARRCSFRWLQRESGNIRQGYVIVAADYGGPACHVTRPEGAVVHPAAGVHAAIREDAASGPVHHTVAGRAVERMGDIHHGSGAPAARFWWPPDHYLLTAFALAAWQSGHGAVKLGRPAMGSDSSISRTGRESPDFRHAGRLLTGPQRARACSVIPRPGSPTWATATTRPAPTRTGESRTTSGRSRHCEAPRQDRICVR